MNSRIASLLSLLFSCFNLLAFTVVIDPGHGGSDKGATYKALAEKERNLFVSRRIELYLKKEGSITPILTRTKDIALPINKRIEIIEKADPDLFITIHFNAEPLLTTNRGFEIYYPTDDFSRPVETYLSDYHRNNISFAISRFFKNHYFKANLHNTWQLPFNMFTAKGLKLFTAQNIPGILIEVAYFSSPDDRACISSDNCLNDVAYYLADTLIKLAKSELLTRLNK